MEDVEKPVPAEELLASATRPWALGIFVKEPLPGRVKTRLVPPLSYDEAADLYRVALAETVQRMLPGPFRVLLFYDGAPEYFRQTFPGLTLRPQQGQTLGERLEQALDSLLADGCVAAGVIGSDSPDLPRAMIEGAFQALEQVEAVTIPATDGGYVYIGVRRALPPLFTDIPWSTAEVGCLTRRRAEQAGIRYLEYGVWEDIDDVAGLQRLLQRSPATATACFAASRLMGALGSR